MAKERYMYGTVLCQKNSDGEKYFINLKTGDKVTVSEPYKHSAKIVLVADEITKGDFFRYLMPLLYISVRDCALFYVYLLTNVHFVCTYIHKTNNKNSV